MNWSMRRLWRQDEGAGGVQIDPGEPAASGAAGDGSNPTPAPAPDDALAALTRQLEEERAARTEAERRNAALNETVMRVLAVPPPPAAPVVEEPAPDPNEDPRGHTEHVARRAVQEALAGQVAPLVQQYRTDRSFMLQSAVEQQFMALRGSADCPGFADMEQAIRALVGQYPLEHVAAQGALKQAYYRVAGERAAKREIEATRQRNNVHDAAGRGTPRREPAAEAPALTAEAQRVLHAFDTSEADVAEYGGAGNMTIDDWNAMKERRASASTRRSAAR
jgi:hypothetical protein